MLSWFPYFLSRSICETGLPRNCLSLSVKYNVFMCFVIPSYKVFSHINEISDFGAILMSLSSCTSDRNVLKNWSRPTYDHHFEMMSVDLKMLKKICHWGPLVAIGMLTRRLFSSTFEEFELIFMQFSAIIKLVSWTTLHCSTLWLPFSTSIGGVLNGVFFFIFAFSTVYNFLCAIAVGPGFIPLNWRPVSTFLKTIVSSDLK